MCGIVGSLVFDYSQESLSHEILERMRDTMHHRGPDGFGLWISQNGRVGLGHRRLSIIDLSDEAGQPMANADGTVQISYNGEIYNHAELRKELEATCNYHWNSDHSDTEVVLHAYEEWGISCIDKFRGMFAIAIWDAKKDCLWLVRDRLGIKPLYYSIRNGKIVFASEIKALLADPAQPREIHSESLFDYLSFLCVPAPNTLFKGIHKVSHASFLRISTDGEITETRYWDVLNHRHDLKGASEEEVAGMILSTLQEAVAMRKMADVPVGVFLSGGIDSSTNAALFSEAGTKAVSTFSIGYEGSYESYTNELDYARSVAGLLRADHYEALLNSQDMLDFLPQMVTFQDEPIGDPVCMPVYYVSRLARSKGVKVCQVGEGADELFWGYDHWKKVLRIQKLSNLPVPGVFRKGVRNILSACGKENDWKYEYISRSCAGQPVFWSGAETLTHHQKMQLLSPRMRKLCIDQSSWRVIKPIWKRFKEHGNTSSSLDWMSYVDLNFRLPELLLMRVDKMSMGVSLEARVPFLDHHFVELAMSIPEHMKTKNGTLKSILKKAVRGVIPDHIIDRKKQGFAAPIHEWFDGQLGREAESQLREFCDATDLLDWRSVKALLNSQNRRSAWHILNVAMWWKAFIAK